MELRQLQNFLEVAESTSLSKASSILGIAQPVLSRQIRVLEKELGVTLFYRHGRGIKLTEEGERFRSKVSPLIHELIVAKTEMSSKSMLPAGSVICGMPPAISALFGARLVVTFLEKFPNVTLHLVDGFSGYVNEWLFERRLDMAIINSARRSPHVHMDPLMRVDLFHVANRRSIPESEQGNPTIPFRDVAARKLILPGRHHGLRRELETEAAALGLKLDILVELDALNAIKELVLHNIAATVLPDGTTRDIEGHPDIVIRRVVEPRLTNQYMIAFARYRPFTLAMSELARVIKAEVRIAIEEGRLAGQQPLPSGVYPDA